MIQSQTPSKNAEFDRNVAFSRNLGIVTQDELDTLKNKTVAIAGLGGAGGVSLLTLVRLGIGGFHIADMEGLSPLRSVWKPQSLAAG